MRCLTRALQRTLIFGLLPAASEQIIFNFPSPIHVSELIVLASALEGVVNERGTCNML